MVAPHVRLVPLEAAQRIKMAIGVDKSLIVVLDQATPLSSELGYEARDLEERAVAELKLDVTPREFTSRTA